MNKKSRDVMRELNDKKEKKMKKTKKTENKLRAVVVTTEHRGVFFGYTKKTNGNTIHLKQARNCIYWPSAVRGFIGLAVVGPLDGSRVGPAADIEIRKVTTIIEATEVAVKQWEKEPWK